MYNDSIVQCLTTVTDAEKSFYQRMNVTGTNVIGTGSVLDLATTAALPNDSLECSVHVSDSYGGNDSASTSVGIDNRLPSGSVVLSPSAPQEMVDDLICTATASDLDGQGLSYSYTWTSDAGAVVSSSIVSGSTTTAGEIWTCTVTVDDGISSINLQGNVTIAGGCADPFDTNCDSIVDGRILATGSVTTCVINNTGQIECWGDNSSNQLMTIPQGSLFHYPSVDNMVVLSGRKWKR